MADENKKAITGRTAESASPVGKPELQKESMSPVARDFERILVDPPNEHKSAFPVGDRPVINPQNIIDAILNPTPTAQASGEQASFAKAED